jgi:hypothetical protein
MKTLAIITVLGLLATGVIKQNLVTIDVPTSSEIKNKIEYMRCYKNEFNTRERTGLLPADARRKCLRELKVKAVNAALAEHRYEDLDKLLNQE